MPPRIVCASCSPRWRTRCPRKSSSRAQRWLASVFSLVDQTVENYQSRNFTDLLVSFGCTGGQHRSVYLAERLARHFGAAHPGVLVRHLRLDERR